MEEGPEGTPPSSDPDGGDPHPCPEDDEFFGVPDAESQEEAINRFMEGLEQQERRGFSQIDILISSLPVPVLKKTRCMSHAQALEGGFVPSMSEDEQNRFTPSELKLYKHALEYKWTVEELKKVITMLHDPEFDSKEVDPDLHRYIQ